MGDLQDLVERQEPGLDIYRETAQLHAQLHQVLLYRKTAQVHQVLLHRDPPSLMPSYTRYSYTGKQPRYMHCPATPGVHQVLHYRETPHNKTNIFFPSRLV